MLPNAHYRSNIATPIVQESIHSTSIPTHPSVYPAPITDPQLVEIHRGPTNRPPSTVHLPSSSISSPTTLLTPPPALA